MFGGTPNPYDEIVAKTTSETLTAESWDLILTLCDQIAETTPPSLGASQAVQALAKRLAHRNPNVQLYALTVAEAIGKNCGKDGLRELNGKVWVNALERVVEDRTTGVGGGAEKVRRKALGLVGYWCEVLGMDEEEGGLGDEGLMGDLRVKLTDKHYSLTPPPSPPPPQVDDEIRRKEEEELQRVLALSLSDKGGRWGAAAAAATGEAAGSSSSSGNMATAYSTGYTPAPQPTSFNSTSGQTYTSTTSDHHTHPQEQPQPQPPATSSPSPPRSPAPDLSNQIITRVRALHAFESTEPGELGFEQGDIIKVVDRNYKDWWRGQLKGRTGIFPVNYVTPLPSPTPSELAHELEEELNIFKQGIQVEKLLTMLRTYDPKDRGVGSFGDDEEIQELYRGAILLRPKIVKLIDKYSQKRADLVSMNETFIRARTIFDRMMEESLARPDLPSYGQPPAWNYQQQQQQQHQQQQQQQQQQGAGRQSMYGMGPYPGGYPQQQAGMGQIPQQAMSPQPQGQPQPQQQAQPQPQPIQQAQPAAAPPPAAQPPQQEQPPHITTGPPYAFVPGATYADPNVQAWATYYTQGGKDIAGAVYFVHVPGVASPATSPVPPVQQVQIQQQPQQAQPQQQQQPQQIQVQQQPQPQAQVQPQPQQQPQAQVQPQPQPQPQGSSMSRAGSYQAVRPAQVQQPQAAQVQQPLQPQVSPYQPAQGQPPQVQQQQPEQQQATPSFHPAPQPAAQSDNASVLPYAQPNVGSGINGGSTASIGDGGVGEVTSNAAPNSVGQPESYVPSPASQPQPQPQAQPTSQPQQPQLQRQESIQSELVNPYDMEPSPIPLTSPAIQRDVNGEADDAHPELVNPHDLHPQPSATTGGVGTFGPGASLDIGSIVGAGMMGVRDENEGVGGGHGQQPHPQQSPLHGSAMEQQQQQPKLPHSPSYQQRVPSYTAPTLAQQSQHDLPIYDGSSPHSPPAQTQMQTPYGQSPYIHHPSQTQQQPQRGMYGGISLTDGPSPPTSALSVNSAQLQLQQQQQQQQHPPNNSAIIQHQQYETEQPPAPPQKEQQPQRGIYGGTSLTDGPSPPTSALSINSAQLQHQQQQTQPPPPTDSTDGLGSGLGRTPTWVLPKRKASPILHFKSGGGGGVVHRGDGQEHDGDGVGR